MRLVGAANVDLPAAARAGRFREDLLDRLSFDVITVPPLRERREDVLLLAQKFAEGMAQELGREYFAGFAPAAERALLQYEWPGNVRELRNVVERAVYRLEHERQVVERVEFDPFASPYRPRTTVAAAAAEAPAAREEPATEPEQMQASLPVDLSAEVAAFETRLLQQALVEGRYNQKRAAELLGLSYHQFRGMLRKYKLLETAQQSA